MPRKDYRAFCSQAKRRGIAVEMSFEEWWAIWKPHQDQRMICGRNTWLVLARNRDAGPYKLGNVYLTSNSQNVRDWARWRRERLQIPCSS